MSNLPRLLTGAKPGGGGLRLLLLPPDPQNLNEVRIQNAKLDTSLLGEVGIVYSLHTVHQLHGQNLLAIVILATDLDEEGPSTFSGVPSAFLMSVAGRSRGDAELRKHTHIPTLLYR